MKGYFLYKKYYYTENSKQLFVFFHEKNLKFMSEKLKLGNVSAYWEITGK